MNIIIVLRGQQGRDPVKLAPRRAPRNVNLVPQRTEPEEDLLRGGGCFDMPSGRNQHRHEPRSLTLLVALDAIGGKTHDDGVSAAREDQIEWPRSIVASRPVPKRGRPRSAWEAHEVGQTATKGGGAARAGCGRRVGTGSAEGRLDTASSGWD